MPSKRFYFWSQQAGCVIDYRPEELMNSGQIYMLYLFKYKNRYLCFRE